MQPSAWSVRHRGINRGIGIDWLRFGRRLWGYVNLILRDSQGRQGNQRGRREQHGSHSLSSDTGIRTLADST